MYLSWRILMGIHVHYDESKIDRSSDVLVQQILTDNINENLRRQMTKYARLSLICATINGTRTCSGFGCYLAPPNEVKDKPEKHNEE